MIRKNNCQKNLIKNLILNRKLITIDIFNNFILKIMKKNEELVYNKNNKLKYKIKKKIISHFFQTQNNLMKFSNNHKEMILIKIMINTCKIKKKKVIFIKQIKIKKMIHIIINLLRKCKIKLKKSSKNII